MCLLRCLQSVKIENKPPRYGLNKENGGKNRRFSRVDKTKKWQKVKNLSKSFENHLPKKEKKGMIGTVKNKN